MLVIEDLELLAVRPSWGHKVVGAGDRGCLLCDVFALMHAHACMLSNGVLFERH